MDVQRRLTRHSELTRPSRRTFVKGLAMGGVVAGLGLWRDTAWAQGARRHDHKVMGTVSVIHENHLDVKEVKTGKTAVITLNDKTTILRGGEVVKAADIKVGDRVVVTAVTQKDKEGKEMLVAKEVRLGTASSSEAQQ